MMASQNDKYSEELSAITDVNRVRERAIELLDEEARARAQELIRETGSQYERDRNFLDNRYIVQYNKFNAVYDNPQAALDSYTASVDKFNRKIADGIELSRLERFQLSESEKKYNALKKKIQEATQVVTAYENAQAILNGTYVSSARAAQNFTDSLNGIDTATPFVSELSKALKDVSTLMSLLSTAEKEMADNGEITRSTLQKLMDSTGDYSKYIEIF
jgi:hypothetical protein